MVGRGGGSPFRMTPNDLIARILHQQLFLLVKPCPRQDSNLRPQDYQLVVFDGSRRLSLAGVAQRFSPRQPYQPLSVILADSRSLTVNKRWLESKTASDEIGWLSDADGKVEP